MKPLLLAAILASLANPLSASSACYAEDDLSTLLKKLTSKDPAIQSEGMSDLFITHDGVLACLPALVEIANRSTPENRTEALRLISGFGLHGKSAAGKLRTLLQDKNTEIRIAAADAILSLEGKNDAAVNTLAEALRAENAKHRKAAAQALETHGLAAKRAIKELIAASGDADPEVRVEIVRALGRVTPSRNEEVVAALRKRLADEAADIRGSAAEALWGLDEPAEALLPTLIKIVSDFKADPKRDVTGDIWGHDAAVEIIGKIGPEAKAAIPVLIAALDSRQTGERMAAADALGEIGSEAAPAVERLSKSLRDTESHSFPFAHNAWYVSDQAAAALQKIGPAARPTFLAALSDKDERVRALAANSLGKMSPDVETVAALRKLLMDKDVPARAIAAFNLGRMGAAADDAAPQLASLLNDTGEWLSAPGGGIASRFTVGQHALEALQSIRPKGDKIVPAIVEILKRDRRIEPDMLEMLRFLGRDAKEATAAIEPSLKDEKTRLVAAQALARINPDYPGLLEVFQQGLRESAEDDWRAGRASRGLGDLGAKARPAIPGIYAELENTNDPSAKAILAAAIVKIDPKEAKAVRALAEALQDSPDQFFLQAGHEEAIETWRSLGPNAAPPEEFLLTGLKRNLPDKDKDYFWRPREELRLRLRSAELLIDVGSKRPEVIDALIQLCDSDDCGIRGRSADALGRIGPSAAKGVPALIQMFLDDDLYVVGGDFYGNGGVHNYPGEHALAALIKIGEPAVPALREALRNEDRQVRERAAQALGDIGPSARPASSDLITTLKDSNFHVRAAAAEALGKIGDSREETISALIPLLRDNHLQVRTVTAQALGKLGPEAKKAIPDLNRLRDDTFEAARKAATEALARLEAK